MLKHGGLLFGRFDKERERNKIGKFARDELTA